MPKIRTKITFDKVRARAVIKAASDEALTAMGNQALTDIFQYVPKDQGTLQSSGLSGSDMTAEAGRFALRWSTPYAQYLWHGDVMHGTPDSRDYGPEKLKFTDAMARQEWAKYAREVYGEEWKKVYETVLKRRMQQE